MGTQWRTLVQLEKDSDKEDLQAISARGDVAASTIIGKLIAKFVSDWKSKHGEA